MNLNSFSKRMFFRAKNVSREAGKVVQEAALALDQALVLSTPVKTGRARSNWIVSITTASDQILEAKSAQAAINHGKAVIKTHTPGKAIHITNNLPYIVALNQGSSAQAPAMFVERAIDVALATVRGVRIDTGSSR